MEVVRRKLTSSLLVIIVLILSSCGETTVFDEFQPVGGVWHQDSIQSFVVPIEDNSKPFAVIMKLRHNADYPYSNLYLFRTIASSNGTEYTDTVNLAIADKQGKWLGNGVGEVKTMEWVFADRGLKFTDQRKYTFTLQHGMRDTLLIGVMDVGLELTQIKEQNTN